MKHKKHLIYLNNLVRDDYFIEMVYNSDIDPQYFETFDNETDDPNVLEDYFNVVEGMFFDNGVEFKSFWN